jgi:superfamily II DNA or RNA helicase
MHFDFKPGSLVSLRNRPWMVLPSEDPDLLLVKPLGGSDDEITGIFLPLSHEADRPVSYSFVRPSASQPGEFSSARLLYNAARLSFRNVAGPFRCLGKLSFRPRSYQLVPLIMALRQNPTRLLIADDVGIGKTIEALLIARELHERREISRLAIICLPHLCDQWQDELKSKFGVEAVIIRSGTASSLEKQIRTNENIFRAFPYQIISIDYIKTGTKLQVFLDHAPEFVIVDEAHSCARPAGTNTSQQLRHNLLHRLMTQNPEQHLVMLTATPHSGKQQEFQSLLGLLHPEFESINLVEATPEERKRVARHFIQRRRGDVIRWLDEETVFPKRISTDVAYPVGQEYGTLFNEILEYARSIVREHTTDLRKQRLSYWEALALLRGVMSSPEAGVSMLIKKAQKKRLSEGEEELEAAGMEGEEADSEVLDSGFSGEDNLPVALLSKTRITADAESRRLMDFAFRLSNIGGIQKDQKALVALKTVKEWIGNGLNPIIYCRYIHTARYLGNIFLSELSGRSYRDLHIEIITSELDDELRKGKIETMKKADRRLLIATDCLSEGINLQDSFNAVIHYDLPWNPNRLEQREGRVDRFGQQTPVIHVARIFGENNPVDGVVLDVLYKKSDEIRRSTGITVPLPEDSTSVMNAVMQAVLIRNAGIKQVATQLSLFESEEISFTRKSLEEALQRASEKEKATRTIFAQNAIKAGDIEGNLKEIDEAIGSVETVENFVIGALRFMGVQAEKNTHGYHIYTTNIPERLRELLTNKPEILVSFKSPTPAGFKYLGRNHPFTEQLAQSVINDALSGKEGSAARSSVVRTRAVDQKTVLLQFRVRSVIAEQPANRSIVAEEMWIWGYRGEVGSGQFLREEEAFSLFMQTIITSNVEPGEQEYWLNEELAWINDDVKFRKITDPVAYERAVHLVKLHSGVRNLVGGSKFVPVEPVLPMDVLGISVLLPEL